jgi:hypothetical protein
VAGRDGSGRRAAQKDLPDLTRWMLATGLRIAGRKIVNPHAAAALEAAAVTRAAE